MDTSTMNIAQIATSDIGEADSKLSDLVRDVAAAGLVPTLTGPGPFTVLAPTNAAAFDKLDRSTLDSVRSDPRAR